MKSVTLVGYSSTSRVGADLAGEYGEVWGLNQLYHNVEANWTRWFEIHVEDYLRQQEKHWTWLRRQSIPVYMQRHHPEIPFSREYPRGKVNTYLMERFGAVQDYFTSSFSYMLALAMLEGFTEVNIYGVDFYEDHESYFERSGLEYLIGLAQGSGIRVNVSPASPLLHVGYVYGYIEPRLRLDQVQPALDFLDSAIKQAEGSLDKSSEYLVEHAAAMKAQDHDLFMDWYDSLKITRGNIRGLRQARTWLGFYGKGGTLLLPDGSVNE